MIRLFGVIVILSLLTTSCVNANDKNAETSSFTLEDVNKAYGLDIKFDKDQDRYYTNGTDQQIFHITSYSYMENYFHAEKNKVENWDVTFDSSGIPVNHMTANEGDQYYPITIAQYGLEHYDLFLIQHADTDKKKFLTVADYFLKTQDKQGGWPILFDHTFYKGRTEIIKAPWYSALAQGQAMSVLTRAYHLTGDKTYLMAAKKGLHLFTVTTDKNGILTYFEGKYPWYEEYPTQPSSFVLNGFIFSLIGLHDVYEASGDVQAQKLYKDGVNSLENMISLYDLGNRTSYDLTHFTSKTGGPPNIAKWGYHITHINCLETLNAIEKNPVFDQIIKRWIGYTRGITAKTN